MHFTCIIDFNLNMSALYQIFIAWPWKLASPFQPRVSAGQGYHMMPPLWNQKLQKLLENTTWSCILFFSSISALTPTDKSLFDWFHSWPS